MGVKCWARETFCPRDLGMLAKELQRYKLLLEAKRRELLTAGTDEDSVIPGAGHVQGDPGDEANANAEAELEIQLHHTDGRLLGAIEEAFARMRHGTYGTCESCKQPISKARLEAVPWTRHCRGCKERQST
jgi:DnaK suppressor protein